MWIIEDDEWFIRDKKTTENMTRMQYLTMPVAVSLNISV